MKILAAAAGLSIFILAGAAYGADEKIDPATYICAEIVASSVDGAPPIFEGLQLDGYAAGKAGQAVADPQGLEQILLIVSDSCSAKPGDKALAHWQNARKVFPHVDEGSWRADRTTCGDYQANQDDGSGFVIWLDGYQRAKTGKQASVFKDQATLDHFLEVCAKNPQRLMYDVMVENAK